MKHTVEEIKLSNGVRGLLIDVPGSEVVHSEVVFNSGFRFSKPEKYEMPHITEHLLIGANEDYPDSILFKQAVEKNGASFNAFTSDHFNWYMWQCAEFEIGRLLRLGTSQLGKPLITDEDVITEKSRVKEELEGYMSDHSATVGDNLEHELELRPKNATRIKQLDSISAQNMKDYYRRSHNRRNSMVFASGATGRNRDVILRGFEELTQALPQQGKRWQVQLPQRRLLDKPIWEFREIAQIYYRLVFLSGAIKQEEAAAYSLLATLLNSFLGGSIYGEVYKRGLAYHIYSRFGYDALEKAFWIGGTVSPANSLKLFSLVSSQLNKIKNGKVTQKDIAAAKKITLGQAKIKYQRPSSVLSYYSEDYMLFGQYLKMEQWESLKQSVTKEQLTQAAQKLTRTNTWALSMLGPVNQALADKLYDKASAISS